MPSCSVMSDFAIPWPVACQVPLSERFSRQEYQSGLLGPPPGDLPHPGIKPRVCEHLPALASRGSPLLALPGKPKEAHSGCYMESRWTGQGSETSKKLGQVSKESMAHSGNGGRIPCRQVSETPWGWILACVGSTSLPNTGEPQSRVGEVGTGSGAFTQGAVDEGHPGRDVRVEGEAGMGSRELCLDNLERKEQVSKTASAHETLAWCHLPGLQGYLHVGISWQSSG